MRRPARKDACIRHCRGRPAAPAARCAGLLALVALLIAAPGEAADPQPYRVEVAPTGERELDATLRDTSQLLALRSTAPVSPFALISRARGDVKRLTTVLESFGYYQSTVSITLEGQALDAAELPQLLVALPPGREAACRISITPGALYHLGKVQLEGEVPEAQRGALGLVSGAPAVAADVLAAGVRLQLALQDAGYAFARVGAPVAYEEPQQHLLDVSFRLETGKTARIGVIDIKGLKRVRRAVVERRLLLHSGDGYRASDVERARQDLLALGVFSAVNMRLAPAPDADGRVPITVEVRERRRRSIALDAAYSTDLGGSGGVSWSSRNLLGYADQLSLSASIINLGGSASTSLGYDLRARYVIPDVGRRDQSLEFSAGALKQSLKAYDQTAQTVGASLRRKLSSVWAVGLGTSTERDTVVQEGQTHDYTLLAVTVSGFYDSTNLASPLDDPRHGLRLNLSIAPTLSRGNPNATFIVSQASAATYLDLRPLLRTEAGRSVLALRAVAGLARGAGQFDLPPDQRFYAGGSGTIRGYRYQSVGPRFADGNPIGGTAMAAGSVELRQRIGTHLGLVVFADGGEVSDSSDPGGGEVRFGAGVGARYYSPIGPVRFDLAVPVRRQHGDDSFEVYIGLGQAF